MNELKPLIPLFEEAMRENEKKSASSKYKNYMEVEKASKDMKAGGMASKRADGIAIRGRTRA